MKKIKDKSILSSFGNRCLILECPFITRDEKLQNLSYGIEDHDDVDPKCTNIDFTKLGDANKVILVNEFANLDHSTVPDQIPVTFLPHKDKVEYKTINCYMASHKLDDESIHYVLDKVQKSDVNDEFAPVNDEIIQNFVDYQWERNAQGVAITQFQYILYGSLLAATVYHQSLGFLCIVGALAFYLIICEFYFMGRTVDKYIKDDIRTSSQKVEKENIFITVTKGIRHHLSDIRNIFNIVGQFSYMTFLVRALITKESGEISRIDHLVHLISIITGTLNGITIFFSFFAQTRYLIYMIIRVIQDFWPFFCVFTASMF